MDGYMGRKTAVGLVFSRGGSILVFREQNFEDRSIKHCNRLACSTRLHSMNGIKTGNTEKVKYSRGFFHSMNSRTITGSSSISCHACDPRKTHQEPRRQTSLQGRAIAESSNRQREIEDLDCEGRRWEVDNLGYHSRQEGPEDSESIHITRCNQTVFSDRDDFGPVNPQGLSRNAAEASGSCSTRLNSRACKQVSRQCRYGDQEASSSSSTRHSFTSRNASRAARHASRGGGAESKKYDLKHLRCTSSDILPSGCSSSNSGVNRRVNTLRKRSLNGGNLSARGQSKNALSGANSGSPNRGSSIHGLSLPEHSMPQQALRRTGAVLVRTRRSPSGVTRTRLSEERDHPLSAPEPEYSSTQMFNVPMGDGNGCQHFSMEGIAEVPLPLERIEQDEELTYEQLSGLVLDGLNFHDQHSDMRMDIDNMTYEELLALEEKMGTVSTALTEEALSKCLERSIYVFACCEEDIKCSICQEEYVDRDEVGKLACKHRYHVTCIHQWLRQKNWCPICKASARPVS
ncbi:E3 ubiquitin-protein ligase RLIM-like [Phoenix dactylifera]|uniref:RING-type E3 ubiquitin transferase n=1 Tax=Phoenix dactylifera TaxID=42345 RepID=A0A8B7C1K0_PHODC|nr:E3 ubiquitin-protein ligase RLIM-like [Phoenix dactylifera]XP_017698266.2 E3 ubiquitin-protein ligase RLIM-like [Phoenix dactylifera]XP_038984004.1 E3 ubiquitin-protein ligase RLIM-like [Phoenix dactylifera]